MAVFDPSHDELRQRARIDYSYELEAMVGQALARRPGGDPITDRALLEACLVHARALDAFFHRAVSDPRPGWQDVVAGHYTTSWATGGGGFLTDTERRGLDRRASHLRGRGLPGYEWLPGSLALRACQTHLRFVADLHPDRADWFAEATQVASVFSGGRRRRLRPQGPSPVGTAAGHRAHDSAPG
jgi:hypothetical protein